MKRAAICIIGIAALALNAFAARDDLVGLWRFDGDGGDAVDSSGNGNDGEFVNGGERVDTDWGMGVQLAAADGSYVLAPVPHSNTVTYVIWAKYSALPSNNPGLLHAQATDGDEGAPATKIIGIWVENSHTLWGRFIPPGGGNVNLPKNKKLEADTWFHVAMVMDADAGKALQYVNGEEVGSANYAGELGPYKFLKIGRQGTETWEGVLDEVGFFHSALSEDEIASIHTDGFDALLSVDPNGKMASAWAELKTQ